MTEFTHLATYPGRSGDHEFEVAITVEVTSHGYPAIGPSFSSPGEPAEPPEWQIVSIFVEIDGDLIPAESWFTVTDLDHLWSWAEDLDLVDEVAEALIADREAYEEYRAEQRRDE